MPRTRSKNDIYPHPVDMHVGAKVKARRLMLGLSQEELANGIGLTFQQVQKYERGTNRISVSRLIDISKALRTPVDYFLDGCVASSRKKAVRGVADNAQEAFTGDPMTKKDVLVLIRAYEKIKTPRMKKQLLEMAKALANSDKKS